MAVVFIIIIICFSVYIVQKDKIEQRKKKYQGILNNIENDQTKEQKYLLSEYQHQNIIEMADIISKILNEYQQYISPQRLLLTKNRIEESINENNFCNLYNLYMILEKTNRDNVHTDLGNYLKNK